MVRSKKSMIIFILIIVICTCIIVLKWEHELPFEKIGSFDWKVPIQENPIFGTQWYSLSIFPESYIPLDAFADLYKQATGLDYTDVYTFDFENYTYIVVNGYELQSISYNHWDIWGKFTGVYKWYHGKVVLVDSGNACAINIYRIEHMLIESDEHARGLGQMDSRIVILH